MVRLQLRVGAFIDVPCSIVEELREWLRRRRSQLGQRSPLAAELLLWLTEAALSVSAGDGLKQKMRWDEDGREGQLEALSKREDAGPAR